MTAGYSVMEALYLRLHSKIHMLILLAEQLKLVGGGEFKIPYVSESSIGIGNTNNAPSILGDRTDCLGAGILRSNKNCSTRRCLSIFSSNVYNPVKAHLIIWRVPDVKVIDMDITMDIPIHFIQRMASSPSSSILSDAIAKNPSIFYG
jgi:hypothetical protein